MSNVFGLFRMCKYPELGRKFLIVFAFIFAAALAGPSLQAQDTLRKGELLRTNERLLSKNGEFYCILQGDGNLCVRDRSDRFIWGTMSQCHEPCALVMQADNHLCIYSGEPACRSFVWGSGSNGKGSTQAHLVMQDDGNLAMYSGDDYIWGSVHHRAHSGNFFSQANRFFGREGKTFIGRDFGKGVSVAARAVAVVFPVTAPVALPLSEAAAGASAAQELANRK